ncbi:uncharacterized protein LOC142106642 [Mixophyes fleayi]|uniref:uncharacterized protein LOC142106642 n=1 Tax=Mixophyes fleayi TaxID=3061075 RepID=UPI003F4E269C
MFHLGTSDLIKQEPDPVDDNTDTEDFHSINFPARKNGSKQKRTVTRTLTAGPKKRKVGFQVPGDSLSLEEREATHLRVLEGMVKPFREQPSFVFDPIKAPDQKSESAAEQEDQRDIGNTDWCKCGRCSSMSTVEESICCHEISSLGSHLTDECTCITQHLAFQDLCSRSKLRRTSYRAFVIWAHGFLDFRNYKPIPACVVKRVQEFLPYPEDRNVGFLKMCDYPAAIMALDHI